MENFIEYINQFEEFSTEQIDFVQQKASYLDLKKDEYFIEAGRVFKSVGIILEGIMRICYFDNKGNEITKIFLEPVHLLLGMENVPSSEYIQAITDCKMLVFKLEDWKEINQVIPNWEGMVQKSERSALIKKLRLVSPLVSQDASTRYKEFLIKYPLLANKIPLAYIASYIGITQQSLSRIRKNIR